MGVKEQLLQKAITEIREICETADYYNLESLNADGEDFGCKESLFEIKNIIERTDRKLKEAGYAVY